MNKLLTIIVVLSSLLMQAGGQAVVVPVQNSSFEQGSTAWQFGPSSGIMQKGGTPVAYAGYGGTFSQDLGISPRTVQKPSPGWPYGTEGVYVLTFSVANYFPSYPGYYSAEIDFGTQELCEASGWGTYHFSQVTLTCPCSNYIVLAKALPGGGPVQGSNDLVIHFTVNDGSANGGWPVLFEDVSLTFTPN